MKLQPSQTITERYAAALCDLPPSGGGGCHAALLGVANLGVMAGLSDSDIFHDLRAHVHGTRKVSDGEIRDAIEKARADCTAGTSADGKTHRASVRHIRPMPRTDKSTLQRLLDAGADSSEADLWEASPVRIDWPPEEDAPRFFEFLYRPDDLLFCGDRYDDGILGDTIRPAAEWITHFRAGAPVPPHIIPNPLSGKEGPTKSGGTTLRGDSCIESYRFALVEFDTLTRDEQIAFWSTVPLPVAALIDTGGKSIHGWVKVDCANVAEWNEIVREGLFTARLVPMGVDRSCKNESRLSRLPGHKRGDRWQRVLYLSPEGGRIHV